MVQMGAKTTTITEAHMLQQEMDLLKNLQKEDKKSYNEEVSKLPDSKQQIIWKNVILITLLHVMAVSCFYSCALHTKYQTIIWGELFFLQIYKFMISINKQSKYNKLLKNDFSPHIQNKGIRISDLWQSINTSIEFD